MEFNRVRRRPLLHDIRIFHDGYWMTGRYKELDVMRMQHKCWIRWIRLGCVLREFDERGLFGHGTLHRW